MLEEEREALLQAGLWLAKALAAENRFAELGGLEDALRPPNAIFWGDHLAAIRAYAADPAIAPAAAATALRSFAGSQRKGDIPLFPVLHPNVLSDPEKRNVPFSPSPAWFGVFDPGKQ